MDHLGTTATGMTRRRLEPTETVKRKVDLPCSDICSIATDT